jgi:hypothetical protein
MSRNTPEGGAQEDSPSRSAQNEWSPWRWCAETWATIAVIALFAASCGVIGVLGSGFVFDPDDHGTDFYVSLAASQLEVLVAEVIVCAFAGLSCVLAIVRGSAQRTSAIPASIGAVGFVLVVVLLFFALQFGIPSLAQTRTWATAPPI